MFGGITVVFDGKGEVFIYPKREKFNINVVYTKDGSADDWIKSIIEKSKNPKALTIATDDREVKDFARIHNCQILSSKELIDKISPPKQEAPQTLEDKDEFVDSHKAKAITEELKKKWHI